MNDNQYQQTKFAIEDFSDAVKGLDPQDPNFLKYKKEYVRELKKAIEAACPDVSSYPYRDVVKGQD